MFINREVSHAAMQFWLLTDVELAESYEDYVEGRSRYDYHLIQNELESRGLTLDDLEEILSNTHQQ